MKKFTAFFLILLLLFTLAGCGELREQDPYRTDTVIYIPAEPTEPKPEPVTEAEPETTDAPESETTEETVPETTKAASTKKPSSGSDKKPSSDSSKKPSSNTEPTTAPTTAPTEAPTTEAITEATTEAATEATTVPMETEPPMYDISGYVAGSLETAMMDEINSCRAAEGLDELSKSSRLCAIASARAYEICQSWSHTRPDGRGYATVFGDYGFGCSVSAENLLYTSGGEDAATLVSKWMGSDGTRNNLLSTGFTTVGIGIYAANGYVYIACLLAG